MVASRLIDSTLYGVDCADRLPAANSTALIREVTAHARDLAPQRLVSSCSNAAGDMRVHRVFVWMAGSYNAVTISE